MIINKYTLFSRKYSSISYYTIYTYSHVFQNTRKTERAPSHSATTIWPKPWMRGMYSHTVESAHISSLVSPSVSLRYRTTQSLRLLSNAILISIINGDRKKKRNFDRRERTRDICLGAPKMIKNKIIICYEIIIKILSRLKTNLCAPF